MVILNNTYVCKSATADEVILVRENGSGMLTVKGSNVLAVQVGKKYLVVVDYVLVTGNHSIEITEVA